MMIIVFARERKTGQQKQLKFTDTVKNGDFAYRAVEYVVKKIKQKT